MDACAAERTDDDPPLPVKRSPPQTHPEAAAATETTDQHSAFKTQWLLSHWHLKSHQDI